MKLVIVESPTKAKTISKFLGKGYKVLSSFGHVRDLPKGKMGIDIEGGTFEPHYVAPKDKAAKIKDLKEVAKKADEIYYATDEDREGEAISWHLAHIFKTKDKDVKRLVFHEITPHAIKEAMEHPRPLDMHLVDAQQARRILDRLVGYELSPLLWKKIARGLSAGRVQSVAVRLAVEREREIKAFKPEEYWTIQGIFSTNKKKSEFEAGLDKVEGKKLTKFDLNKKDQTDKILKDLEGAEYSITEIEKKSGKSTPSAPFKTSTLQQEAHHKLGYSSKQIMRLAQQLYEGIDLGIEGHIGLITYMRTDSLNLSDKFVGETRDYISDEIGKKYVPAKPRTFANKTKNAQEAHEAIHPTNPTITPDSIKQYLDPQQYRLYDLIWRRAVATQMSDAKLDRTTVLFENTKGKKYTFRAKGQTVIFDGYLKLYPDKIKDELLPELKEKQEVDCKELTANQHFTEPPARYSDATLVKALEEHGIGRPSTYAPTIATIESRGYVVRDEKKRLEPTETAEVVTDLLVEHFPDIVDLEFTAKMEDELDEIAEGKKEWQPMIKNFYMPFKKNLDEKQKSLTKKVKEIDQKCPKCDKPLIERFGRFGKFIACSGYPECKYTHETKAHENKEDPQHEKIDKPCPECKKPLALKHGRYGTFIGCSGYPDCKHIEKIEKKTGAKCTECGKGEIVERKSKKGKMFYSCNKYPDCKFALWQRPTGEKCPDCKSLLTFKNKTTVACSNKDCGFEKTQEEKAQE